MGFVFSWQASELVSQASQLASGTAFHFSNTKDNLLVEQETVSQLDNIPPRKLWVFAEYKHNPE